MPVVSLFSAERNYRHVLFIVLMLIGIRSNCLAQPKIPPLERIVSINMQNAPIKEVLNRIAALGKFSFSYNNRAFNAEEKISANFSNKPVRYILTRIFHGRITYKAKGEYIILLANGTPEAKPKKTDFRLKVNGYIIDSLSRQKIKDVSVFDPKTLYSSLTDDYGYFSIEFPSEVSTVDLKIRKVGYKDTSIHIRQSKFQSVEISLLPVKPLVFQDMSQSHLLEKQAIDTTKPILLPADSSQANILSRLKLLGRLVSKNLLTNTKNVTDSIFRVIQFSFLPSIGTNRLFGGNVTNDYSLNLIAGYSQGVNKAEVAGFFNIDRGNVKYVQAAGFGNFVGGRVEGVQAAGFLNIVLDSVKAVQAAGFVNVARSDVEGVQAAGFGNNARSIKGVQAAGFYNFLSKDMYGVQASGMFNVCFGKSYGTQAAGAFNVNAGTMNGMQASGLFNASIKDFYGAQVSSLFNYAGNLKKGAQIALFNFSDSNNGVPIGLFSFVLHGYHKLELSADEVFYLNVSFRTGVKKLHNILTAGMDPLSTTTHYWTVGYGLGATFKLVRKLDMDIDLTANHISQGKLVNSPLYYKLYAGFDLHASKNLSIALGPTLNFYLIDPGDNATINTLKDNNISYMYNQKLASSNYDLRAWVGGKLAIRFL